MASASTKGSCWSLAVVISSCKVCSSCKNPENKIHECLHLRMPIPSGFSCNLSLIVALANSLWVFTQQSVWFGHICKFFLLNVLYCLKILCLDSSHEILYSWSKYISVVFLLLFQINLLSDPIPSTICILWSLARKIQHYCNFLIWSNSLQRLSHFG